MSLFVSSNVTCPHCAKTVTMDAVGSVNADRRPDLREAILDDSFQQITCTHCGVGFRLEPEFNYLDVRRGQWIAAMPSRRLGDFREVETQTLDSFAIAYGASAPLQAQAVGDGLVPRLTFGWPAMREKLLIRDRDLDDTTVEIVKLELLRRLDEAPLSGDVELRLRDVQGDEMRFVWVNMNDEEVVEDVTVSRRIYDTIAGGIEQWAVTRDRLSEGPFVDSKRLFIGLEPEPA
jgi:hypothetical protein